MRGAAHSGMGPIIRTTWEDSPSESVQAFASISVDLDATSVEAVWSELCEHMAHLDALDLICATHRWRWPCRDRLDCRRALLVAPVTGECTVCRCTDDFGCPEGCGWADIDHTLCTNCMERA